MLLPTIPATSGIGKRIYALLGGWHNWAGIRGWQIKRVWLVLDRTSGHGLQGWLQKKRLHYIAGILHNAAMGIQQSSSTGESRMEERVLTKACKDGL
jgi:hypothetical protein